MIHNYIGFIQKTQMNLTIIQEKLFDDYFCLKIMHLPTSQNVDQTSKDILLFVIVISYS